MGYFNIMSLRDNYRDILGWRKEIKTLTEQLVLWRTRGPVEIRETIRQHQNRLLAIKHGATPYHKEVEDIQSAIKWCQNRLKNPQITIFDLEMELKFLHDLIHLSKDAIHWREQRLLEKWNEIKIVLESKIKTENWFKHEYPRIRGAG
jgi:uncharacterized coiled-coil DUF342 family protein